MRLTTILLLACSMHVAASGFTQVTLHMRNKPLLEVFQEIQRQTGYDFVYSTEMLSKAGKVNVHIDNRTVEDAMKEVLKGMELGYVIEGRIISIKAAEKKKNDIPRPVLNNETPPISVYGKIVNEKGEPVIASVTVKGTNKGATSDANGNFRLDNVDDKAVLIITATNIETALIALQGNSTLAITVNSAISSLSEVVVNKGYYTETQRLSTGNVAKVGAKDIEKQPITNPLSVLQGRVAGVYIQQQSGLPGGGFDIKIRGANSLREPEGNYPLYIVDGVPFVSSPVNTNSTVGYVVQASNPLNYISPSNIESIEVLKDADATAIYGSRGANGVVLITTKKSKRGININMNLSEGVGKIARKMKLLNTQQYLEMRNEAMKNDGLLSYLQDPQFDAFWPDLKIWDTTRYTDWQKELVGGTAKYTNAQVGVSGGNDQTQFSLGGNFYKETTVFPGDFNFKRASGYLNINHSAFGNRLNLSMTNSYTVGDNRLPDYDYFQYTVSLSPNTPEPFNADGTLNFANSTFGNPYALLKKRYKGLNTNLVSNFTIKYELVKALFIKASFGLNTLQNDEVQLTPISSLNPAENNTGSNYTQNASVKTWIIEPQVEYSRLLGKGKLSALAGGTFQNTAQKSILLEGAGFTSDALIENLLAAPNFYLRGAAQSQYRYNAVFARLNYNLFDKYIVNITGRRDGSSRFGPGKQFGNFGAAGAAWIFSEEGFFRKSMPFLSLGKLRASYGTTGSDQIGNYMYLDSYLAVNNPYNGVSALVPSRLANVDYSWETNKKLEIGAELGFLKDAVVITASYYRNRSSNQLVGYPLSLVAGQPTIQYNFPATVQNTGTEITFFAKPVSRRLFSWTTNFNITIPKSKLVAFPGIERFDFYSRRYTVGEPISAQRFQHLTGVDPQTGVYTFQDFDNNGSDIDFPADYNYLKNVGQNYFGGWSNAVHYRNFSLDFTFQFVKQNGYGFKYNFSGAPGGMTNQLTDVMDRWQKPGDIATYQQFTTGIIGGSAAEKNYLFTQSDASIVDASFIRLKNVSVSWNITRFAASMLHINGLRLYAQAQNLLTITDYKGNDPELQSFRLPISRVIMAGIEISF